MFCIVFEKFKVFNSVVRRIAVDVMNNLFGLKVSPKMLFHYETMLKNSLGKFVGKRVRWSGNNNISTYTLYSSLPSRVIGECFGTFFRAKPSKALFSWFIFCCKKCCSTIFTSLDYAIATANTRLCSLSYSQNVWAAIVKFNFISYFHTDKIAYCIRYVKHNSYGVEYAI